MKLAFAITALLLGGCAAATPTTALSSLDERPVTKGCLTDPPPVTDTFMNGKCETLTSIDERERAPLNDPNAYQVQPGPVGAQFLAVDEEPEPAVQGVPSPAAVPTQDKAVDQYGNPWTEERKAFAKKVNELAKRFAQQYRAAKRPVFRLKFRHQYPTMSEEEIEVLVDDAVEEGGREAMQKERQRLFGGPGMRPPILSPPVSCTSSQMGSYTYTDCY